MYKKILLAVLFLYFLVPAYALKPDSLKPSGWVNDFASIINADDESKLTSLITELEQKTGVEIAVVTISSLEGEDLEGFTNTLFRQWGVGKKGKNNGIMFLVAYNEKKIRIEVGYGLEGLIPDAVAGRIIRDNMAPYFRQGNPSGGILSGVYTAAMLIAKDRGVDITGNYAVAGTVVNNRMSTQDIIIAAVLLLIFVPMLIRNPWLLLFFLTGSGRGSGGYSSGGFGGGFGGGGFGGGSSGGGGASGGW